MASLEIHVQARECIEAFKLLLRIEVQVRERGESKHLQPDELRTDDQLARFRMWAGNIGVFAGGHASLDYRLRDNDDAKKVVNRFLESLRDSLRRALEALPDSSNVLDTGLLLRDHSQESLVDTIEDSVSSQISSSFQGTETDSIQDLLRDSSLQIPFERHLQEVERTIDRLYRLSVLIRQPSITYQNSKADKFVITDEEGNDINESFADFSFQLLTHRFPEAPKQLRQRLARGVTVRRRRFQYRKSHQRKLSAQERVIPPENLRDTSEVDSTVRGFGNLVESPVQENGHQLRKFPNLRLPSLTSASAMTRRPIPVEKITEDDASKQSTVFTMAFTQDAPVSIPGPPKPAPGSKEFECPYCCIILPINQAKASHWRKHVLNDLEPYSCVFENCPADDALFRDYRAWNAHMKKAHASRWICTLVGHRPCTFDNEQVYEDHMWAAHNGTFTESQLPVLKRRSKTPGIVLFEECPLCGFKPSENDVKRTIKNRGLEERKQVAAEAASDLITRHLAGHLESVSVRALPWQEIPEDPKSESTLSKRAEEGSGMSEDDVSLNFDETASHLSLDDQSSKEAITWPDVDDDTLIDSSVTSYEQEYEYDWGFIPLPPYYGHDRDPTLQTLLRKLYLDTSSPAIHGHGPQLPAFSVPVDRDKNFVGRKFALNAIKDVLCPGYFTASAASKPPTFPRCFTIYGPGGLGKTQVAAQFVVTHRQDFDAILWVHAENSSKIAQDFRAIAISLGLVSEDSVDATDLTFTRNVVKRWLVNPVKRIANSGSPSAEKASWLIVFDGVEEPDDLNEFWPYDGPGSILVTSRSPYSWSASLLLRPLSADEATNYLLQVTGRCPEEKEELDVKIIAARLGGLPLALAQMGSIIVHKGLSFTQFLRLYDEKESHQQLLHWQVSDARPQISNYEHNIASVWAFDSLAQSGTLLNILSMLDADGVPEKIFLRDDNDNSLPEALSQSAYKKARKELLARSLVTGNKHEKKLFIHRLVQDVARARMRPSELRTTFHLCVKLLSASWPFETFTWRQGVARWAACEELFTHVQKLKDLHLEITHSAYTLEDYEFAKLLVDVGWYRYERGKFIDVVHLNNMAQSICESLKLQILEDPDSLDGNVTLEQLNYALNELNHNRGCVALATNEIQDSLKYLKLFNRMMVREFKDKPPSNDMRLAISWNELGNAYMLDHDWAKGEQAFVNSIEEMKKLTNFISTSLSLPIANLGLAYWFQKKNDKAIETLMQGLEDRKAAFGYDDTTSFITGRLLHAVGNVKNSQGLFDESHDYHRRALFLYKSTLGNRHHRTADVFVKVAEHNIRLNQHEMALALLDRAIEAYSYSSSFILEKARTSFKRIKALRSLQKAEEAESELEKCFKIYTMIFKDRVREGRVKESVRKTRAEDLRGEDFDELMVFWSR